MATRKAPSRPTSRPRQATDAATDTAAGSRRRQTKRPPVADAQALRVALWDVIQAQPHTHLGWLTVLNVLLAVQMDVVEALASLAEFEADL